MRGRKVDLFLGGPLGLWVLDNVDPRDVYRVITFDNAIFDKAKALNIEVTAGIYNTEKPAVGLSVHYPRLLRQCTIDGYKHIYNIHPGLLPWGRCYYPVFWALWADEPAGCTLHEIDAGIDTGPIVDQRNVPKYNWDTGGTLHQRVSDAEKGMFLEYWPRIAAGDMPPAMPQEGAGSFHLRDEFTDLKLYGGDQVGTITQLLKMVRCLSHPDYSGLIVHAGGKQYEVSARPV